MQKNSRRMNQKVCPYQEEGLGHCSISIASHWPKISLRMGGGGGRAHRN